MDTVIKNYLKKYGIKNLHQWDVEWCRFFDTRILRTAIIGDKLVVYESDSYPDGRLYRIFIVSPDGSLVQYGGDEWSFSRAEGHKCFDKLVKKALRNGVQVEA